MTTVSNMDIITGIVGTDSYFQRAFDAWIPSCPRLIQFITENKNKIKRKIRLAQNEEQKEDLMMELHIAWLLLKEPEFEVKYEFWGTKEANPDYLVTQNGKDQWAIEVKHLRDISQPLNFDSDEFELLEIPSNESRLRNIVTRSKKQWRFDVPTVLWINTRCGNTDVDELPDVLFKLNENNILDDLSGAFILSTWRSSLTNTRSLLRVNSNTKKQLPTDAINFLVNAEKRDSLY